MPEAQPNHCFICKRDVVAADGSCPHCGNLLWFPEPGFSTFLYKSVDLSELGNRFDDWIDRVPGGRLVIDFQDVDFIGSSVLGKLISLHRKVVARGGTVTIRNVRPMIMDVFKVTKLDQLFPFEGS